MQVIYIEIFFAENFLFNYILLKISDFILVKRPKWHRTAIAAALGSFYALLVYPFSMTILNAFPVRLLFTVLMCLIAFDDKKIIDIIKSIFAFVSVSVFTGGMCYMISGAFGIVNVSQGVLITSYQFKYILLGFFAAFSSVPFLKGIIKRFKLFNSLIYDIKIYKGDATVLLKAYLDTGNNVCDIFGNQAIIVEKDAVKQIYDDSKVLETELLSIGGNANLKLISGIDKIIIKNKTDIILKNPMLFAFEGKLSKNNEYNALIGKNHIL